MEDESKWMRGTARWRWQEPTPMIGEERPVTSSRRKTFVGPMHAIDPETRRTLCGKATEGWFVEDDFWRGMIDRCETCEENAD